jgi:hypothetical protein
MDKTFTAKTGRMRNEKLFFPLYYMSELENLLYNSLYFSLRTL